MQRGNAISAIKTLDFRQIPKKTLGKVFFLKNLLGILAECHWRLANF